MIAQKKRDMLGKSLPENSLIILVGKTEQIRNGDVYYPFRQDWDFLLLTGLDIPALVLLWIKKNGFVEWRIYSESITEKEKLWGTARLSHEELRWISGIDDIREMQYASSDIRSLLLGVDHIGIRDQLTYLDEKNFLRKFQLSQKRSSYIALSSYIRPLRMYKTEEEVENIEKAVSITHQAYDKKKKNIQPWMYEYEIEACIAWVYRANATVESYPTIVASGPNSCVMHYVRHDRKLEHGDHILIDFGAEYRGYSSDVTRVFFVGDPSARKKAIYMATKRVKDYAQSLISTQKSRKGHEGLVRIFLVEELRSLGLISWNISSDEAMVLSRKYLPYKSLNHHLGLDTHDVGSGDDMIAPWMVLTCEPGIYIPEEGIGMRLEDDLLITEDGYKNLSWKIPLLDFL